MATNKDILEAQRYNRRRLLTAFMAGTTSSGGEFEARSYSRPFVVGAVLTAILLLVGLVSGRFAPRLPDDWENSTLVIQEGSGARLLAVEGVLRPVRNTTSARLLSEPGRFRVVTLPASTLAGIPRGSEVGLEDAPDATPLPQDLRSDQWVSCATPEAETHTWIGSRPAGLTDAGVAVVSNEGRLYVLANGRRHAVRRDNDSDAVRLALRLDQATVHPVSGTWLSLFEHGTDLAPLTVPRTGTPAADMPARLSSAVVGSAIEVQDEGSTRHFVVTGDGTIAPLTDTAFQLHQVAASGARGTPLTATPQDIAQLTVTEGSIPQDWPATIRDAVDDAHLPCARLNPADTRTATLAEVPADPDQEADVNKAGVSVAGSSGALVRRVSGGTLGPVVLVSDLGQAHGLGDTSDTLSRLGYTPGAVTELPAPWLNLVPAGPELSATKARATLRES